PTSSTRDWSSDVCPSDLSQRAPGAPDAPYRFLPDSTQQFLLRSGCTSFLGMGFESLRRMAVDIEVTTAPGFEFPNAARESDRIKIGRASCTDRCKIAMAR